MQIVEQSITVWSAFVTAPYSGVKDQNFHVLYGNRRFITMITKAVPRQIQPTFSSFIYKMKRWDIQVSIPGKDKKFFSSPKRSPMGPTQHPVQWVPSFFLREYSGRGAKVTIQPLLQPRLRMSGAILLLPLYTFMVKTGKTRCALLFFFFFTLDARLLARSRYSEGPATGHLDTGFSWFPCA